MSIQHETDHLDGTLLIESMDQAQRKSAMKAIRDAHRGVQQAPTIKVGSCATFGKGR